MCGLFNVVTSVGCVDGTVKCIENITDEKLLSKYSNGKFEISSVTEKKNSVYIRHDILKNISDKPIFLNKYFYRFAFEKDDVDVYSQQSGWMKESKGEFTKLTTGICIENYGVRATTGAAPFMAIWDNISNKGMCFHIVPSVSWKMTAKRRATRLNDNILVVEMGISDDRLNMQILPGEEIYLPEVIYYSFDNKTYMGCDKLHEYLISKYPVKRLPVIYNTWFSNFDVIDYDYCMKQAKIASDIGCEYFVVDAGWFGEQDSWYLHIGDWKENLTGAFCGRLKEFADNVRSLGMKFGLWLEPERALSGTESVKEYPEYYINENDDYFIDFSNPEALKYIENIVFDLIEKYGIEFLKFDFNADCGFDNKNAGFYYYHRGNQKFISDIKEKYPDIYIENCASGGGRLDLFHSKFMDGTWCSDNHSIESEVSILTDSILRMNPSSLERWIAIKSVDGFTDVCHEEKSHSRLVSPLNSTWANIIGTNIKYVDNFAYGGALGLTCNLEEINEEHLKEIKSIVARFKKERDFYKNATCKVLLSNDYLKILQYNDVDEKKVCIKLFEKEMYQGKVTVYPILKKGLDYEGYTFEELKDYGITFVRPHNTAASDFSDSITLIAKGL